jgi:hypothetical protein
VIPGTARLLAVEMGTDYPIDSGSLQSQICEHLKISVAGFSNHYFIGKTAGCESMDQREGQPAKSITGLKSGDFDP